MYAHVKEDGSVDYMGSLPKSWGNVSGLGQSNGNDLVEPVEEPNEEDTISTDTVIPTGPTDK